MKQTLPVIILLFFISLGHFSALAQEEYDSEVVNQENKPEVKLSPNPFEDIVNIEVSPDRNITEIKIFDLVGKEVAKINLKGVIKTEVNLSHIKPGVYFVTIYTNKGIVETRKLYRSK